MVLIRGLGLGPLAAHPERCGYAQVQGNEAPNSPVPTDNALREKARRGYLSSQLGFAHGPSAICHPRRAHTGNALRGRVIDASLALPSAILVRVSVCSHYRMRHADALPCMPLGCALQSRLDLNLVLRRDNAMHHPKCMKLDAVLQSSVTLQRATPLIHAVSRPRRALSVQYLGA